LPEGSVLTRDRVADGEDEGTIHVILGENKEAVKGGLRIKGLVKPGDTLELTVGGPVI
jgi:predicted DNA-binding protein with PD1-like motif